jgi:small subunit ribosomal protein S16
MIVIRLARMGKRARPYYRLVAQHNRKWRNGKCLDLLGTWDPLPDKDGNKKLRLHSERIRYWMSVGAQPSKTVARLLGKAGVLPPPPVVPTKLRAVADDE